MVPPPPKRNFNQNQNQDTSRPDTPLSLALSLFSSSLPIPDILTVTRKVGRLKSSLSVWVSEFDVTERPSARQER